MNKEIVIRSINSAVDFAVLHDGKLIELQKEKDNNKFNVGDIFIAKIKKTITGLNAAFVNVGYEKDAFLHYTDLSPFAKSILKFTRGRNSRVKGFKKAIVTLKKGQSIDLTTGI